MPFSFFGVFFFFALAAGVKFKEKRVKVTLFSPSFFRSFSPFPFLVANYLFRFFRSCEMLELRE